MTDVATALALLLAGVLGWAGAVKLGRPGPTAASFAGLGLPAPGALARLVPLAELGTAALLVLRPRFGAVAALLLLLAFTGLLAVRLRAGGTVDCGCFGTARSEPLTSAALVRNALLIAAAAVVLATAGAGGLPALEAVLVAGAAGVIGALAVALWDLRARTGRLWDNHLVTGPVG
jgi:uncharacterized membrane protein YphA (DoxX/SURF4 family)